METRRLGRTEHMSSVVTFGAICVGRGVSQKAADTAIQSAIDHGVNHIDVAPGYGQAMERLANSMQTIRGEIFLGAKTGERAHGDAWKSIRSCQERLGVETFDLFQLHGVSTMEHLDAVTAREGALQALIEMRKHGLTRFIGITGHGPEAPQVHREALRRFDFDTIMFPVSPAIFRNQRYRREAEALLADAAARDVGVQSIKMLARGGWGNREKDFNVWYDPHREQPDIDRSLWFVLSQPVHTAPSTGDLRLLPMILDAAERFRPLSEGEQRRVVEAQRPPDAEPKLAIDVAG
jgi:aryl-alcohol dehydrogenase-like predicted oxidoreductase